MNWNSTKSLMAAWLTMFVVGADLFVVSPLLPLIAVNLSVSPAIAGLSVSVFSIVYLMSAPLLGHVADRQGRRHILIISLFVFAGANILTAAAGNLLLLLGARSIAGAAAAGVSPSVYALVGGSAPPSRRGTHLAIVVSGLLASLTLAAPIAALAGAAIGWRSVFAGLGVGSLVLVSVNLRVWPGKRGTTSPAEPPSRSTLLVIAVRLAPTVVWSTAVYATYTYLGAGLGVLGYSTEKIAEAILFYGCGSMIGALAGGRIADRYGDRLTATIALAGLGICFLLLRLSLDSGILVAWGFGLSSAVAQVFFPAQQAGLVRDFAGRRAAVLAWNSSALFLGVSLGSVLGGPAISRGGLGADLTLSAVIAIVGALVNGLVVAHFSARSNVALEGYGHSNSAN